MWVKNTKRKTENANLGGNSHLNYWKEKYQQAPDSSKFSQKLSAQ